MHLKTTLVLLSFVLIGAVATMSHGSRDRSRIGTPPLGNIVPNPVVHPPVVGPPVVLPPGVYIQPYDKPYFSRDELKRMAEDPNANSVRRGPPGTPDWNFGYPIQPYKPPPFAVVVDLEGPPAPGEAKLAEEAKRQLLAAKPENPGRNQSFPKWEPIGSGQGERMPLIRTSWYLQIRRVTPIPGGWRTRVLVFPVARTDDYRRVSISNFHIEVYSFKAGKLKLEAEFRNPDPSMNPAEGLRCMIFG